MESRRQNFSSFSLRCHSFSSEQYNFHSESRYFYSLSTPRILYIPQYLYCMRSLTCTFPEFIFEVRCMLPRSVKKVKNKGTIYNILYYSPEEKIRQLEKKVNELIEESCFGNSRGELGLVSSYFYRMKL